MQQDTPDCDKAARTIAENVYAAFVRQASTRAEPLEEQTILTRLVEAIRPEILRGSAQAIVAAANSVLDAWEQRDEDVRGPRVEAVDLRDGAVTMQFS